MTSVFRVYRETFCPGNTEGHEAAAWPGVSPDPREKRPTRVLRKLGRAKRYSRHGIYDQDWKKNG